MSNSKDITKENGTSDNGKTSIAKPANVKAKKNRKKKIAYIIMAILVVASLALVLTSVGKTLPLPFECYTKWDNPTIVNTSNKGYASLIEQTNQLYEAEKNHTEVQNSNDDTNSDNQYSTKTPNGKYSVVVDKFSNRLTVLNSEYQVIAENDFNTFTSKVDKIINLAVTDTDIYVHAIAWTNDGTGIDREEVFRCSIFGERKETIFNVNNLNSNEITDYKNLSINYDGIPQSDWDDVLKSIKIQNIEFFDGHLYITEMPKVNEVVVMKMTQNSEKQWVPEAQGKVVCDVPLNQADYSVYNKKLVLVDIMKNVSQFDAVTEQTKKICTAPYYSGKIVMDELGRVLADQPSKGEIQYYDGQNFKPVLKYVDATHECKISDTNEDIQTAEQITKQLILDDSGYPVYISEGAPYNFVHMLKILAKWAAIVYLCSIIIWLAVIAIKRQKKLYNKGLVGKTTATICVLLTVVGVSCLYLVKQHDASYEDANNNIKFQSCLAADNLSNDVKNSIKNINFDYLYSDNPEYGDIILSEPEFVNYLNVYNELNELPLSSCKNLENVGINIFYSVLAYDKQTNKFYNMGTSDKAYQDYNYYFEDQEKADEISKNGFSKGTAKDDNGQYLYYAKGIFDSDNNLVGLYSFGQYTKYIDISYIIRAGQVAVLLLMVSLIVLAFVLEADNVTNLVRKYKKKRSQKNKLAYCQLTRPMSFFLSLSIGADSVLAVLISKELIQKSPDFCIIEAMGLEEFSYAVPVTVALCALVLGIAVFMKLEEKFTSKTIFVFCSIFMMLGYAFTAQAVILQSYDLLVLAKAISGFFAGVLKTELYSIASSSGNEKERYPLVQGIGRASMLATVCGVLICGSLASSFGYQSVYIFAASAAFICVLFGIIFIPRGIHFVKLKGVPITSVIRNYIFASSKEKDEGKTVQVRLSATGVLKWVFSPRILMLILFVILPYMSAKGYKSYFFPLYANNFGLDKMTISMIYSMATVFAFIMVHPISAITKQIPYRNKIINGLLALGFIFLLFLANSRIEWAILAMFLTMTVGRTFGTPFRMCWMRDCESRGYSVSQLHPVMYFIEESANALQVILFSICMSAGNNYACVIFGVYCVISAIIFSIMSYNSPMRDDWKKPENEIVK